MIGKDYSKQIIDYLTEVEMPKTSKEILANTDIPKDQINVYLTRLKNRDKIWIIGKRGQFNLYMIESKEIYKFHFEQALSICERLYDNLWPSEKAWVKECRKDFSINPRLVDQFEVIV
ncbi:hypothetical protein LCGC14_1382840 [marine sediment metagenome]|uniref:Uncharacterized protein n=1 Tax=marine sediment metagenome TaxID=412755 RepID=A0A0F9MHM2_9ZZZZ